MKYVLRLLISFCGLLVTAIPGLSQTAPVNATLQLTPPYSVYLSDYAVAGNEQMKLNLLLRDLTEPSYEVKLHLTVEGAGIRIETNPSFNPQPIFLEGGVPTILGAEDLAPYLDSRNLIFSGITRQQYDQRATLPEGFYRYCFRVIDYRRRDVELARETCANAWFVLNDPPRINTPLCGTILPLRDPQNIYFQWLAMNSVSPNAALTTEYEFTLAEIRPAGRNPNDVINTSVPIYQTTIQETNLLYGITEPPLIPGQEYVFRIRAIDINGRDLFKNGGYSEVCTFKFGEGNLITPPEQVNVYPETESRARVTWFMNLETDRYKVEYRKKVGITETENSWFTKETIGDYTLLNDLQPDTEYEVRVAGIYRTFTSHPTETKTFRTPQPRVFACGQEAPVSIPPDTKPLITAMVGQRWKIGKFEMEVVSVQGGSGVFTGIGVVIIPYLGFRVYSKFEKVKVNENQEVVQGDVIALSEDWEVFKQNWQPKDPTPDEEEGEEPTEENTPPVFVGVDVPFEGEIDSVYVNPNGDIVIVNEEGEETVIDQPVNAETGEPENTRITDSNGEQWVVDKDGNVTKMDITNSDQEIIVSTRSIPYYLTAPNDTVRYKDSHEFVFIKQNNKIRLTINGVLPDSLLSPNLDSKSIIKRDSLISLLSWKIGGNQTCQKQLSCEIDLSKEGVQAVEVLSNRKAIIKIKVNVYKKPVVHFLAHRGFHGEYGFDNGYKFTPLQSDYSNLKLGGSDYFVQWITLLDNQRIDVELDVKTLEAKASKDPNFRIKLRANDSTLIRINGQASLVLSYNQVKANPSITVSAVSFNHSNFTSPLFIEALDHKNQLLGRINVACSQSTPMQIYFIYVDSGNGYPRNASNLSPNNILNFTNSQSHNQFFRRWEIAVDTLLTDTLNIVKDYKNNSSDFTDRNKVLQSLVTKYFLKNKVPVMSKPDVVFCFLTDLNVPAGSDNVGGKSLRGGNVVGMFAGGDLEATAHELGHILNLFHTFPDQNGSNAIIGTKLIPQGTTKNYMDYIPSGRNMFFLYQFTSVR